MTVQILDVYYQNKFDVATAERELNTGTDAVMIKGGQGQYQTYDANKSTHIDSAAIVNMPHGIFWQMDARYTPESHKAAIKIFFDKHGFGNLGLFLACEMPFYPCPQALYSLMPYAWYKPIKSVWRGLTSYTGSAPGIYISISKWKLIFGKCPLSLQQEFAASARLWQAQYKCTRPDLIGQWPTYHWWQYTEGPDYSVANCSDEEFQERYGNVGANHDSPADPPPATPAPIYDRGQILDQAIKAIEAIK